MGKEGEPLAVDSRRTHYCGELNLSHVGEKVKLGGWVNSTRDHGGLLFLDLRDRTGVVQLVFHPEAGGLLEQAQALRSECVLWVEGQVVQRPEGRTNPALPTGQVEVVPARMEVLSTARPLPFEINGRREPDEALRLRYRYLDLRRPEMLSYLRFRHRAVKAARDFFDGRGFWEVETPMLTRSTPEGARDYLVPSRLQHGHFYALPQSPQLFKQLLMVAGVDRYFQIARCFRDEDLRADRQPEFTQIDVEMAFVQEEDVLEMTEQLMAHLFRVCLGEKLDTPFPRLTWDEAMDLYGTDKPDLRFEWQLVDLSDLAATTEFRVFREALAAGGVVRGLLLPGGGLSRREVEELAADIAPLGARGLAWVAWEAATGNEPMA
ncbi:MAG TPA: aspartate--tRNA ligase, partial [Firmicutes bacterium]|nr:aspartate--tRNA ligase [Bacillota bacterium]